MLEDGLAQWRRYDDAQSVRNFRQDVAGALGNFRGACGAAHFALNPLAVSHGDGRLRSNLLRKKAIRRSGGHTPRRSVRLVEETAVLQVRHQVSNGRGAERLFEPLGNCARGYRLARFDVRADNIGQNLAVPPFLECSIPHEQHYSEC